MGKIGQNWPPTSPFVSRHVQTLTPLLPRPYSPLRTLIDVSVFMFHWSCSTPEVSCGRGIYTVETRRLGGGGGLGFLVSVDWIVDAAAS